jgi:hypothetical protein
MSGHDLRAGPVFVHAMWRTGSTYFFHKLRKDCQFCTFYEPLNEGLLHLTEQKRKDGHSETARLLRHDFLDRHYFDEYPLESSGGVQGLLPEFCYRKYALAEDADEPALEAYFRHLITIAATQSRRPVLQCNRTLMRVGWLKRRFGGAHILLVRSPRQVWMSFASQPSYFSAVICEILGHHLDHKLLGPIAHRWHITRPTRTLDFTALSRIVDTLSHRMYGLFHAFYVVTLMTSFRRCDLLIDLGQVTQSPEIITGVESRLREFDVSLSLEDCAVPQHCITSVEDMRAQEAENRAWLPTICGDALNADRRGLESRMTPLSAEVLEEMLPYLA